MIRNFQSPKVAAMVMLVAIALWMVLMGEGVIPSWLAQFRSSLPLWFPTANLFLVPLLAAVFSLRSALPLWARAVLLLLLLISLSSLGLSYDSRPGLTIAVTLFYFVEILFIIPRMNKALDARLSPLQNSERKE